ncbi:lipopolysaccharide heptosyltransferase I [Marinimicrobium sp. ABcell2]|uniref:lipopolysaccharide heptosyltransferase I n=1 Tax=Marinimicrobium sp. ABcell2 TaxID=3069751 RepID=UPI0027AEE7C5|nr:lipopolysaccharide heptosyltransferase I [Marinimicrobium sp. ABcell2]MDQ2077157.1 lipopolysaccharide heptosyltransferase I [Marinimicrobium sp. ABcell2]
MKILLIKMSSMGDLFHTFPALTDLKAHHPDAEIDWLVEESFAEIAAWHPAVNRVIPINLRQWMKHKRREDLRAFKAWRHELQQKQYDLVLDAQGLLKSAVITRFANASESHGYHTDSAREAIASWFYQVKHHVNKDEHAVLRTRKLFASTFGYPLEESFRFGIQEHFTGGSADSKQLIFIPGSSWRTKLWSLEAWQGLTVLATEQGYQVEIIWGSDDERQMADCIATSHPQAWRSAERQSITRVAEKLVSAAGVVGMDTGFSHLSGALETPTVALYGPTSPTKVGLIGDHTVNMTLTPALPCMPCHKRQCRFLPADSAETPPCMKDIDPSHVWQALQEKMS